MLISHKHKFIFIHIWKTGGTSVCECLRPYAEQKQTDRQQSFFQRLFQKKAVFPISSDFEQHITFSELQKKIPTKYFEPYFKFAFVRNPLSWEVSYYHFITQQVNEHPQKEVIRKLRNFEDFIKWAAEHEMHYHSQKPFVFNRNGDLYPNFLGKFENLADDFSKVCELLHITCPPLAHLNKSKHDAYLKYYTSETETIVRTILKEDFEAFGYL